MASMVLPAWLVAAVLAPLSAFGVVVLHGQDRERLERDFAASIYETKSAGPTMFVAIFTQRGELDRRRHVRGMWQRATEVSRGSLRARFILCKKDDSVSRALELEGQVFGDMVSLSCEEGYGSGLLTRKLYRTMQYYLERPTVETFFMKVDDDTFVSSARLLSLLEAKKEEQFLYMGVSVCAGARVNRDPSSRWYQPVDTYPNQTWPRTMEGGPGYILGGRLVQSIVESGIAEGHLGISNEDQAAGVWVYEMQQRGEKVKYARIAGTDGYRPEHDVCSGSWGDYPYMLHHNLDGEVISCLSIAAHENDPAASIDHCFGSCQGIHRVRVHEVGQGPPWRRFSLKQ